MGQEHGRPPNGGLAPTVPGQVRSAVSAGSNPALNNNLSRKRRFREAMSYSPIVSTGLAK